MLHSPAAILIRLALSVVLDLGALFYMGACLMLGHAIAWKPTLGVLLLACMLAPPLRDVRGLLDEIAARIKDSMPH